MLVARLLLSEDLLTWERSSRLLWSLQDFCRDRYRRETIVVVLRFADVAKVVVRLVDMGVFLFNRS